MVAFKIEKYNVEPRLMDSGKTQMRHDGELSWLPTDTPTSDEVRDFIVELIGPTPDGFRQLSFTTHHEIFGRKTDFQAVYEEACTCTKTA